MRTAHLGLSEHRGGARAAAGERQITGSDGLCDGTDLLLSGQACRAETGDRMCYVFQRVRRASKEAEKWFILLEQEAAQPI